MWTTLDGEGGVGQEPVVQKRMEKSASMSVLDSDTSPPRPRGSGLQYMWRFGRFYAPNGPDVRGRVCLPNGRCWIEGAVQKVSFC